MDVLALGTAGAGSLGEETVAGGCMGPAIWVTLDRNAKAGGITLLLRFLEENKQGHLIGKKKKKGKRHLHNKNTSESDCLLEKADQCV